MGIMSYKPREWQVSCHIHIVSYTAGVWRLVVLWTDFLV